MKKLLPWVSAGIGCLLTFSGAPGCGSDEIAGEGSGGSASSAGGSASSAGGSSTFGSGGFNSTTGGSKTGGAFGVASGGGANASMMLGARCANDAACGAGLTCLTSDSGALSGGGPAGGICTADCKANAAICQTFGPNSRCVGNAQQAFCLEGCLLGSPAATEVKCHNRAEMACSGLDATGTVAACLPQCNGGSGECKQGTFCDLASAAVSFGLCRAVAPVGLPTGAKCDPAAATDPCRGACVAFSTTVGACQDGCTVGSPNSCNPAGGAAVDGFCLQLADTDGAGDAGLCAKLCDCSADCGHVDMKCFGSANVQAVIGRKGVCDVQRAGDTAMLTASIIDTCVGAVGAGTGGAGSGGAPAASGGSGGANIAGFAGSN